MKIVLDTNVLMSAVFFGGVPGRILEAFRTGSVELVYSREVLDEYARVGERLSERFGDLNLGSILAAIAAAGTLVDARPLPERVSRDPDDDKFLACAGAAGAAFIVSGDHDLLDLGEWDETPILSPREFVDRHLG